MRRVKGLCKKVLCYEGFERRRIERDRSWTNDYRKDMRATRTKKGGGRMATYELKGR